MTMKDERALYGALKEISLRKTYCKER